MPRGKKSVKKVVDNQPQEDKKIYEWPDICNREPFEEQLQKKRLKSEVINGVVYVVVKPDKIKDTLIIMDQCKEAVNYKGSYGAGVQQK